MQLTAVSSGLQPNAEGVYGSAALAKMRED